MCGRWTMHGYASRYIVSFSCGPCIDQNHPFYTPFATELFQGPKFLFPFLHIKTCLLVGYIYIKFL